MSSTRHSDGTGPFRQERYASSVEFEKGLMGNLVAKRCSVIASRSDRSLIYFLQKLSHEIGLKAVAEKLVADFPGQVCTPCMKRYGFRNGEIYNSDQVRSIRKEFGKGGPFREFLLKGERSALAFFEEIIDEDDEDDWRTDTRESRKRAEARRKKSESYPDTYPASAFSEICESAAKGLEDNLKELCLNPAICVESYSLWFFSDIIPTLLEFMAQWIESKNRGIVVTQIGREINETLDYTLQTRCLSIVDGLARSGKTFAAKAWCEANPGRARYVEIPSPADETGLYREICRALGISVSYASKARELRDRVEDTLRSGDLMLVADEAHYLWPQANKRDALPSRINWLMTGLVNRGVPVCLITTPQFMRAQKEVERKTYWTSEQLTGRIGHYTKLPDSIIDSELEAVTRSLLPEGDSASIRAIVTYANVSAKYVGGIVSAVKRAKYLAQKDKMEKVQYCHVYAAVFENALPSDSNITEAAFTQAKTGKRGKRKQTDAGATRLQDECRDPADTNFAEDRSATLPVSKSNRLDLVGLDLLPA